MIVTGGSYREECLVPEWRRIFGSGGRAAAAVSLLSPGSELHTYACRLWADDVRHSMAAYGIAANVTEIVDDILFSYIHPMGEPRLRPWKFDPREALQVNGDVVLRFGFVEGDAIVHAQCAVFDPQSSDRYEGFRANGSTAERLAIVANEGELRRSTGQSSLDDAVRLVQARDSPEVVIVKQGVSGAAIFVQGVEAKRVPAYRSDRVFKIGSGDVFTAIFAHCWAERQMASEAAADLASRSVAHYVASRVTQIPNREELVHGAAINGPFGSIYLAGPFFDLAQRWIIEEALDRLMVLGAEVFSPLHRVGTGGAATEIATEDLEGLRKCSAVLALVDSSDPGTLFEVGFARSIGIPVVALAQNVRACDLTMLSGTGCEIADDFSSALYRVLWAAKT